MKASKILLNITSFFCFIYFALYTFTLVFIPIGIYCFLAGKRFAYKAEHIDDTMRFPNKYFKNYVIFVSIACFPFGLLAIIPYVLLTTNNVKVSNLSYTDTRNETKTETEEEKASDIVADKKESTETEEEKLEKFKKLENFKEKGFITEEELEQAREQLFGKKDNN